MKKASTASLVVTYLTLTLGASAFAGKPQEIIDLSNGFPSGAHENLIVVTKNPATFVCPTPEEYQVQNSEPNVMYVPEYSPDSTIEILIESGRKGPKSGPTTESLTVTDWCAGFEPGDNRVSFRLPKNEEGYAGYARVLGKPSKDEDPRQITVFPAELDLVQDEGGSDLLVLGLVTQNTLVDQDSQTFVRVKGKSKAMEITHLFEFTGSVCYVDMPDGFDVSLDGYSTDCCALVDTDLDGIYDVNNGCGLFDVDESGLPVCLDPNVEVYCQEFTSEWMLNIADFVDLIWGVEPGGAKVLQVRWYPIQQVTF